MPAIPVNLPPLKLHKNKHYTYVFTYTGIWEPAVKDADGNVIKKGRSRSINRKTVGKIIGGGDSGVIVFYEEFLDSHPELRDYTVVRNSDGTMTFTGISSHTADNHSEQGQISTLIEHHGDELDGDSRGIKSSDGVPVGADPADIFESSFAGEAIYLQHLSFKTGVHAALAKTFQQRCKVKHRDARHYARYIETVVYNMIVSGENTYEGLSRFCSEHAAGDGVAGNDLNFFKYINYIDKAFIDCFHRNFFDEYFKGSSERILNSWLFIGADVFPVDHTGDDIMFSSMEDRNDVMFNNQLNLQFVCDADKNGLPVFYDLFDGHSGEASPFCSVMQKLASCNVSLGRNCFVVDRGYPSHESICTLLRNDHTFVFRCNIEEDTEVQDVISKAIADNIYGNSTFIELESDSTHCADYTRTYSYDEEHLEGKSSSRKATAELRYHVFFDSDIHHLAEKRLNYDLIELNSLITSGSRLTEHQKELLKKYSDYDVSKYVEGKPDSAPVYLPSRLEEGTRYEGFQVLITNDLRLTSAMVLAIYNSRPKVEIPAQDIMQHIKCSTADADTDRELQSIIFLQYIAAIFVASMSHDITDA